MGFIKDFKNFAVKGNVVDMAVGVIIGGAFGKIVTSLVNDLVMPLIGIVIGKVNLKELAWKIGEGETAINVAYGNFLQNIIDFLIIALSIFVVIKMIENLKKRYEKPAEPVEVVEPEKPNYEVLLEDIKTSLEKIAANSENK